jgi:hypothetical protein
MSKLRIYGFGSLACLLLTAAPALAGKPVPVSECDTFIYEPGKYFVTQDLFCGPDQQGITVYSSDVTVDLKGHTITCGPAVEELVGAVLVGEYTEPGFVLNNVRVRNGTVSDCSDGVIFFYTRSGKISKITANNSEGGITLIEAVDTVVKNNVGTSNLNAIRSFGGFNNEFKHNWSTGSFDAGLLVDAGETGSRLICNTSERDAYGIALGPTSSGNIVRGNFIDETGDTGITLYGLKWDTWFWDYPYDNVVTKNLVQASGRADLAEVAYDLLAEDLAVPEGAECENSWYMNQYSTWMGPENCVAPPVVLDKDDVCALDDDDSD